MGGILPAFVLTGFASSAYLNNVLFASDTESKEVPVNNSDNPEMYNLGSQKSSGILLLPQNSCNRSIDYFSRFFSMHILTFALVFKIE